MQHFSIAAHEACQVCEVLVLTFRMVSSFFSLLMFENKMKSCCVLSWLGGVWDGNLLTGPCGEQANFTFGLQDVEILVSFPSSSAQQSNFSECCP